MTTRPMSKSPLAVAREALRAVTGALPAYSSARSRHDYTQPQLFAALALRQFFRTDYRGIAAILADSSDLRAVLGLTKVPHYSTLAYAARRLARLEQGHPKLEEQVAAAKGGGVRSVDRLPSEADGRGRGRERDQGGPGQG